MVWRGARDAVFVRWDEGEGEERGWMGCDVLCVEVAVLYQDRIVVCF